MKRIFFPLCLCLMFLSACTSPVALPAPTASLQPEKSPPPKAITPQPTEALPTTAPSSQPEVKPEPREAFEYMGLIELMELDSSFVIDVKYATADNFTGEILYDMPLVLVQKEAGLQLLEAQKLFMADGYALKIFDVYRPLSIQQKLYDATPPGLKNFVSKPSPNAKHCKGIAVDCTLVDFEGNELDMPSGYDEFSERASTGYTGGTDEQRKNRDYLIETMEKCGFTVYRDEWWHFVASDDGSYETLDILFSEFLVLRDKYDILEKVINGHLRELVGYNFGDWVTVEDRDKLVPGNAETLFQDEYTLFFGGYSPGQKLSGVHFLSGSSFFGIKIGKSGVSRLTEVLGEPTYDGVNESGEGGKYITVYIFGNGVEIYAHYNDSVTKVLEYLAVYNKNI